ncbi:protein takeout [Schistocerca gregaria]|uniref:protein takeout n=1 Tax=Schistocerca gregaria TaxID=7010 RepID=UPI00211EC665|nr:protein takeout [Schistocerca gregaria]
MAGRGRGSAFAAAVAAAVALGAVALAGAQRQPLPSYIHVCKRNDPNINNCVKKSVEQIRPYLVRGIPEFHVPSIEPLELKEIIATGGPTLRITATNVRAYGCSDFTINRMSVDMRRDKFDFGIDLPHLYIVARYQVHGRILLIPIHGSGPMRGNFTNCKGDVSLQGKRIIRQGKEYMTFTNMDVRFHVGKGSIHLDNLFGGEKPLGEAVNNAINANFGAFVNELKPSIERALSKAMLEISNRVVHSYPQDVIFPEH